MRAKSVRNPAIAEVTGVHIGTVSGWLSDRFPPSDDKLEAIGALLGVSPAWLKYGDNGRPSVRETPAEPYQARAADAVDFYSATAAQKGKIWIEQFLLELIEEGADQDFTAWARRFLMSPDNYALYVGGAREAMSDEQKLKHMQGLAVGVRAILKDRLKKGGGSDGKNRR